MGVTRVFYELPTGHHPSARGVYFPLRGPWIVTDQHDFSWQRRYREKLPWKEAMFMASAEGKVTDTLDLHIGQVAYQRSVTGEIEIAAYHYCTGD